MKQLIYNSIAKIGENEDLEEEVTIQGEDYKVGVYWTGESNGECEVNYCHVTHLESGLTSSLGWIMSNGYIDNDEDFDATIAINRFTFDSLEKVADDLGY